MAASSPDPTICRLDLNDGVYFNVRLERRGERCCGAIDSNLRERLELTDDANDQPIHAAVDTVTSMILAHACAGLDVTMPEYLAGVNGAIQDIVNSRL